VEQKKQKIGQSSVPVKGTRNGPPGQARNLKRPKRREGNESKPNAVTLLRARKQQGGARKKPVGGGGGEKRKKLNQKKKLMTEIKVAKTMSIPAFGSVQQRRGTSRGAIVLGGEKRKSKEVPQGPRRPSPRSSPPQNQGKRKVKKRSDTLGAPGK